MLWRTKLKNNLKAIHNGLVAGLTYRLLWRTKLKNNLKAIHNAFRAEGFITEVVANQVKEQFESNSQPTTPLLPAPTKLWRTKLKNNLKAIHNKYRNNLFGMQVVANQVKEQFESNSQQYRTPEFVAVSCGEPS